jgi:hypothetical protein
MGTAGRMATTIEELEKRRELARPGRDVVTGRSTVTAGAHPVFFPLSNQKA